MSSAPVPKDLLGSLFLAHPWHGIPARAPGEGDAYNAYVEIVPTDAVKYELDKSSGHLRLDRPQRFSSLCPTLYGFIPQTYCGRAVGARCAERTGLASLAGDGDQADDKIIAVLRSDLVFGQLQDVSECPPGLVERLRHYFLSYKQRPGDPSYHVSIAEVYDRTEALEVIGRSQADYADQYGSLAARAEALKQVFGVG
jgi:inorganic pyrophosphatase